MAWEIDNPMTTYELTDDNANRYGRSDNLTVAKIMARQQAQRSHVRIYVFALAVSDWSDGRYGERCYYMASPEADA